MDKKVLFLSPGPQKRLVEEFKDREVECDVIAPNDLICFLSNVDGRDRLYLKGDDEKNQRIKAKDYFAVVPRISGLSFDYGKMIVKHLSENMGIFTTASEFGLNLCSSKFETCQHLSKYKIRVPKQLLAHNLTDFKEAIELVGNFPVILKLQKGSQGAGVFLLKDETEASQTLRALKYSGLDLVLSQKLDSGKPANDLRIIVIGALTDNPKFVAYKRFALDSEFRSNYSLSHSGEKVTLTEEEREMALKSAIALKMNLAGVDIMRNEPEKDKPYLIEVNGNFGLAGVEAVTGENVAGMIADFVLENYKKGNTFLNKFTPDDTEIKLIEVQASIALRNIEECNLYGNRTDLYKKNFKAQELIKSIIQKSKRMFSDEIGKTN